MQKRDRALSFNPSLSLYFLSGFLLILWLAGGASRAEVLGQVVVRAAAWGLLVAAALLLRSPVIGQARPVAALLAAAVLLVIVQLVPLPPSFWQALPGRAMLADAMTLTGQAQPWRPWTMVPGATINAASSLIVPCVTLLFVLGIRRDEHRWLLGLMLGLIVASVFVGLLQFSGAISGSPFVNTSPGAVSGTFANRNHLALFIAMGFPIASAWAFHDGRRPHWRGPVAIGLLVLFVLMILAIGSRAGLVLSILGLLLGLVGAARGIHRELGHVPRWVFPALIAGLVGLVAGAGAISVLAGRADAIQRVFALDVGQDMRHRASATVFMMIRNYFPMGSGFGSFNTLFRINEPFDLLKPTYFNHAHNDILEVALDGGVFGIVLLVAGIAWWAWASWNAWRGMDNPSRLLPRLGSTMLSMILIASLFDYPIRTPMIMAVTVIAAVWLSGHQGAALPVRNQHL